MPPEENQEITEISFIFSEISQRFEHDKAVIVTFSYRDVHVLLSLVELLEQEEFWEDEDNQTDIDNFVKELKHRLLRSCEIPVAPAFLHVTKISDVIIQLFS